MKITDNELLTYVTTTGSITELYRFSESELKRSSQTEILNIMLSNGSVGYIFSAVSYLQRFHDRATSTGPIFAKFSGLVKLR